MYQKVYQRILKITRLRKYGLAKQIVKTKDGLHLFLVEPKREARIVIIGHDQDTLSKKTDSRKPFLFIKNQIAQPVDTTPKQSSATMPKELPYSGNYLFY